MKKYILLLLSVLVIVLTGCVKEPPQQKPPVIIDPSLPPLEDTEFKEPTYSEWKDAPIFTGVIADEKPAPTPDRCFPGAWYRKVVTQADKWIGMEAIVTLPYFTPDEDRIVASGNHVGKYSDTPSIYIGSKTTEESDIGLAYEVGCVDKACETYSATEKIAFRPFWRHVDENRKNIWNATGIKQLQYYYFPGDKLRLSLYEVPDSPNYARFEIEVLEVTTDPKYVALREKYGLPNNRPIGLVVEKIFVRGVGTKTYTSYKRVNAIDQYGNEGKKAQLTNAFTSDIIWHSTFVFRRINDVVYKVPMTSRRTDDMRCPDRDAFEVKDINEFGGETNNISPSRAKNYLNSVAILPKKEEFFV